MHRARMMAMTLALALAAFLAAGCPPKIKKGPAKPTLPSEETMIRLAKETMLALDASLCADDFRYLLRIGSSEFRRAYSEDQLRDAFHEFIEKHVDVGVTNHVIPVFYRDTRIDEAGRLVLVGSFPSRPSPFFFVFRYAIEDGDWRLYSIAIQVEASDSTGPAEESVGPACEACPDNDASCERCPKREGPKPACDECSEREPPQPACDDENCRRTSSRDRGSTTGPPRSDDPGQDDSTTLPLPDPDQLAAMAQKSLTVLAHAIDTGDYELFYSLIATIWRENTSPKELRREFAAFAANRKYSLTRALGYAELVIDPESAIDDRDVLVIKGYAPGPNYTIGFKLSYVVEKRRWRLAEVQLAAK